MPAETKLTPHLLSRLIAFQEDGLSVQKIARLLKLSPSTVSRYLGLRGLKPNGIFRGKRVETKTPPAPRLTPEEAFVEVAKAEVALDKPGAPRELLRQRLAIITVQIKSNKASFLDGSFSAALYDRLCSLERAYARELALLEPPSEIDPEKDPTNVQAAEWLTAKVEQLVSRAEKEFRCASCGKSPYPTH